MALSRFAIRFLAMTEQLDTFVELQVYLTHLKHGGFEYGVKYLPRFMYLDLWCQVKKEHILWTNMMKAYLQDLEALLELVYKCFAACLRAKASAKS
jgi:hypothetical protein